MRKLIPFFFLFFHYEALSQDTVASSQKVWLDFGFGLTSFRDLAGAFQSEVRIQSGHNLWTAQVAYAKEFNVSFFVPSDLPREQATSFGILYGRTTSFHLRRMLFPLFPFALFIKTEADYSASASAGISVLRGQFRRNVLYHTMGSEGHDVFADERTYFIGFPIQVELVQNFSPSVGYVHRLFYVVNNKRTLWGLVWGVQCYF